MSENHLKRINRAVGRPTRKLDEIKSHSCIWGSYGFPVRPEPTAEAASVEEKQQKKAVA